MKKEFDFGYMLEIYEKNKYYGTVKKKHFVDMLELVTFTNKKARTPNIDYMVNVINQTDFSIVYDGCIYVFNRRVNIALMEGTYR